MNIIIGYLRMKPEVQNKLLYFVIAIVLIGSIGVWIPQIFYLIDEKPLEFKILFQNLTTYYIAIIVVSCTDLALQIIKSLRLTNKIGKILLLTLVGIISVILFTINCYALWKNKPSAVYFIIIGVIVAYTLWWISKRDSDTFNPEDALGGDAS
jgi:hypothetical protein